MSFDVSSPFPNVGLPGANLLETGPVDRRGTRANHSVEVQCSKRWQIAVRKPLPSIYGSFHVWWLPAKARDPLPRPGRDHRRPWNGTNGPYNGHGGRSRRPYNTKAIRTMAELSTEHGTRSYIWATEPLSRAFPFEQGVETVPGF